MALSRIDFLYSALPFSLKKDFSSIFSIVGTASIANFMKRTALFSTTPILLYKQIVNGINYKVITVIREKDTAVFYEDVIYTGPFGSNVTQSEIVYEEEIVTVYNKVSEKTKRKIFELAQNWTNLQIVELNIISFREGNDVIYAGVIDAKNRNVIDGRKSLIIILENNGDYEVIYYE